MPYFVARYHYTDDLPARDAARAEHRAYLGGLGPALVASGPTDANGAVIVLDVADAATVDRVLDADPFVTGGLVAARDVVGWDVVLGRWADPA